jgi:hypothetical protein
VSTVINGSAFFSRGSVLLLHVSLVAQQFGGFVTPVAGNTSGVRSSLAALR